MHYFSRSTITIIISCFMIIVLSFWLFFFSSKLHGTTTNISTSILNMNTIFISILIEALPFVLIGVLIAGMIQIFITEEHIQKWIPKNKYLAVIMSCVIGALFPACECGIVPIVRRLVLKRVPIYAAIGFMLTGPLINPIVIASTYMAFGNDLKIAGLRMVLGFAIAVVIALILSSFSKGNPLKDRVHIQQTHSPTTSSLLHRFWSMLTHSIDEFFAVGKYLVLGAFLAAFIQTYMPAQALLKTGNGPIASLLVMMGLAYFLSLCSEADAFIGASFNSIFPTSSILAFLIYGPMMDFKNTIIMLGVFQAKFVMGLLAIISVIVFLTMWFSSYFL